MFTDDDWNRLRAAAETFGLIIVTSDGDRWHVTKRSSFGDPLRVRHEERHLRGSFLEASFNAALALFQMKRALRATLPLWLQQYVPEPKQWWTIR